MYDVKKFLKICVSKWQILLKAFQKKVPTNKHEKHCNSFLSFYTCSSMHFNSIILFFISHATITVQNWFSYGDIMDIMELKSGVEFQWKQNLVYTESGHILKGTWCSSHRLLAKCGVVMHLDISFFCLWGFYRKPNGFDSYPF